MKSGTLWSALLIEERGIKMKAAVFYKKHDLKIEEIKKPEPGPGEVLIKVMACGICGTDVHIFEGDEGAAATPAGTVLGHEFSGIIEKAGDGVTEFKAGDRVTVDPNKLCGKCSYCRSGIGHFCENIIGIGTTVNGGFSEYCAVPESQVYKIADTTSFSEAAMCEPVACCLHGIGLCGITSGDTVAVIGCGMIGMIMIQLAKISGAAKIIAIEPDEKKLKKAKELGADIVIDPVKEDAGEVIKSHGIDRVAVVIECVGKPGTMEEAIRLAGKKSTVMFFGLTAPGDTIKVKPFELFKKEITIKASYINPYTQGRALALIDGKRIDVSSMVKTEKLTDLPGILADRTKRSAKVIICPNE